MTCVDVGTAQLRSKLRNDPRTLSLEKPDAREINTVEPPPDLRHPGHGPFLHLARRILPIAWQPAGRSGHPVALSNPWFEATEADKGLGVIKVPTIDARVVDVLTAAAKGLSGAQD